MPTSQRYSAPHPQMCPPLQRKFLLLIQSLPPHENLHLSVEGKRAVILAEAVQQFGVFKDVPLITN